MTNFNSKYSPPFRLFIRVFTEVPFITENAIRILKSFCQDEVSFTTVLLAYLCNDLVDAGVSPALTALTHWLHSCLVSASPFLLDSNRSGNKYLKRPGV